MDTVSEYTRKRKEFGKHPRFKETEPIEICDIKPTNEFDEQWKIRPITTLNVDCIPSVSEHYVNTERFIQVDRGMQHLEGGWPKDINTLEFSDKQRYIRKIEMDESFKDTLLVLAQRARECVMQNNAIDMYEDYFVDVRQDHSSEPPNAKTISVLKDPYSNNDSTYSSRSVCKLCWHPENDNKIAVAHASLEFQRMNESTPLESYIWDLTNPNRPETVLLPQSHLCTVAFNRKSPEHLVGGCYNGLIGFWDLRRGSKPVEKTIIEHSHSDPVYDIYWIQSRSGSEFCSVSTDGYIHWWDVRKLGSGPMDSMLLKDEATGQVYGGTSLEYRTDAGATRFLVGTEQGTIITVERKAKKDGDSQKQIKMVYGLDENSKHHAPIYAIERNYFVPKGILTVGDWTTRLWMEDVKTPIITTRYEKSYLTGGCWSPTRAGVFFTTKQDGQVDVWDYYYKQTDPVFQLKISEQPLSTIAIESKGQRMGVGAQDGTVTILKLCESLYEAPSQEKAVISQLFEREMNREKTLQARMLALRRQNQLAAKKKQEQAKDEKKEESVAPEQIDLSAVEEEFFRIVEKFKPKAPKAAETTQNNQSGDNNESSDPPTIMDMVQDTLGMEQ